MLKISEHAQHLGILGNRDVKLQEMFVKNAVVFKSLSRPEDGDSGLHKGKRSDTYMQKLFLEP